MGYQCRGTLIKVSSAVASKLSLSKDTSRPFVYPYPIVSFARNRCHALHTCTDTKWGIQIVTDFGSWYPLGIHIGCHVVGNNFEYGYNFFPTTHDICFVIKRAKHMAKISKVHEHVVAAALSNFFFNGRSSPF